MYIKDILKDVENIFYEDYDKFTKDELDKLNEDFANKLYIAIDNLCLDFKNTFNMKLPNADYYTLELNYDTTNYFSILNIQNTKHPSLNLLITISKRNSDMPYEKFPNISMFLCCDDKDTIKEFRRLYSNYKRTIQLLINKINVPIFLGSLNLSSKTNQKLDFMLLNDFHEESLNLSCKFYSFNQDKEILFTFYTFIILMDCCYHYIDKRKDLDRIINYYFKLKKMKYV